MNAIDAAASLIARPFVVRRRANGMMLNDWLGGLYAGGELPLLLQTTLKGDREEIESSFAGYVSGLYLRNPIVFACIALRARVFSEMRFAFQQLRNTRPGQLFGTPELAILESPEPGKTTGDMLSTAILDADLAGDAFFLRRPDRLRRLRPDWTVILYGSKVDRGLGSWDPDAEIIGFGHTPGGIGSGSDSSTFLREEVAHFVSNRDPLARNRGISLLTAGLREVQGDTAATSHKLAFFRNGATSNLAVTFPADMSKESVEEFIELMDQDHKGAFNAYKTLYIGGGPEAKLIGSNMQEITFKELQGSAETRIASLTGMHPVVVAFSEGLQGSGLNAGNYQSAKRGVADTTLRPLWRNVSGSLATVVNVPPGSRLWYDERDVAFLREDVKDQAEIITKDAQAIGQLIRDGFEPASAIDAVTSGDMNRLIHTGLVSVQLQAPGTSLNGAPPAAAFSVPPTVRAERLDGAQTYRARSDFWAVDEPFAQYETITADTEVPANHPMRLAFGSMFAPVTDNANQIVTRVEVLRARQKLLSAGKDAGHASLARELGVSVATVRRRLAPA